MRNKYIEAQINNMMLSINTFCQSLEFLATKDDGMISKEEQKIIRQLNKASEKYKKSLEEVKSS